MKRARAPAGLIAAVALAGALPAAQDRAVSRIAGRFGVVAFDLNGRAPTALARLSVGVVRGSCFWSDLEPRYSNYDTILGVWNEPNFDLADSAAGSNYALLFINASLARDSVNPRFALAGPDTSHHAAYTGYLQRTMNTIRGYDALEPQDVVGVHWYPDGPPLVSYLDVVHQIVGDRDVWLSETGQHRSRASGGPLRHGAAGVRHERPPVVEPRHLLPALGWHGLLLGIAAAARLFAEAGVRHVSRLDPGSAAAVAAVIMCDGWR
jgi:hypothetical protein